MKQASNDQSLETDKLMWKAIGRVCESHPWSAGILIGTWGWGFLMWTNLLLTR